jgi:integrase
MATVSIILRTDKPKKDGTMPINFLIIKDRKKTKIATSISVDPKHWDEKKCRLKPGATNSARHNSFLSNKLAELQDQVFGHLTVSKSLTARQLKDELYGQPPLDFFNFAQSVFERYKSQGQIGTHDRCQAIINKVKDYLKQGSICFQEITPEFLKDYEKHLRGTLKNSTNTIHANFKFIRQLFNEAINQDLLDPRFDSFKKFKVKTEKTQRIYLTEEELELIEKYDCADNESMTLHRDMFVFAAYTGGLRVSDMLKLKWKNFDKTHIHITVKKTAGQLSIKVPDKSFSIIEKYKSKKFNKEHYVFPMLPNDLDENDVVALDNEISKGTALINKSLKALEDDIELGKHISFHISRHTWATRALRKGISIDKVSKLMGHAQIKETQIYAKIVSSELDKAMDVFND